MVFIVRKPEIPFLSFSFLYTMVKVNGRISTGYFDVTACDVLDREHGAEFVSIKLVEVTFRGMQLMWKPRASLMAQTVKNLLAMQETWI